MKTAHRKAAHAKRRYQADPSSLFKVMNKLQPFTPDEVATVVVPARIAFEKLRNGIGTEDDYNTRVGAVNVTIVLAEKIDPLAEQSAIAARDAVIRTLERQVTTPAQWAVAFERRATVLQINVAAARGEA